MTAPVDHVVEPRSGAVVVLGAFDGVHRGHLALVQEAAARARAARQSLVALVIDRGGSVPQLTSVHRRCQLLVRAGVSSASVVPFRRGQRLADRVGLAVRSWRPSVVLVDVESMSVAERRIVTSDLVASGTTVEKFSALSDPTHGLITTSAIVDRVCRGEVGVAFDLLGRPFEFDGVIERSGGPAARATRWSYSSSDGSIVAPGSGTYVARVRAHRLWHGAALVIGGDDDSRNELVITAPRLSSADLRPIPVEVGVVERWPDDAGLGLDAVSDLLAEWAPRLRTIPR
jgi:FAD synthase